MISANTSPFEHSSFENGKSTENPGKQAAELFRDGKNFQYTVLFPQQAFEMLKGCLLKDQNPAGILIICQDENASELLASFLKKEKFLRDKIRTLPRPKNQNTRTIRQKFLVSYSQRVIDYLRFEKIEKRENEEKNWSLSEFTSRLIIFQSMDDSEKIFQQDIQFVIEKLANLKQTLFIRQDLSELDDADIFKGVKGNITRINDTPFDLVYPNIYTIPYTRQEDLDYFVQFLNRKGRLPETTLIFTENQKYNTDLPAKVICLPTGPQHKIQSILESLSDIAPGSEDTDPQFSIIIFRLSSQTAGTIFKMLDPHDQGSHFVFGSYKERKKMSKDQFIQNEDTLKSKIKDILRKIRTEEDPFEITEYKKFLNNNVSIFMRGNFAAYLLKQLSGKGGISSNFTARRAGYQNRETQKKSYSSNSSSSSSENTVTSSSNTDTKTLFVSMGKNRKVFPRDWTKLFVQNLEMKAEDMGDIKVLDNYSFIDVPSDVAAKAIDKLNGINFRGRKLSVNFARKKED